MINENNKSDTAKLLKEFAAALPAFIESIRSLPAVALSLSSSVRWLEDATKDQRSAAATLKEAADALKGSSQSQRGTFTKPGIGKATGKGRSLLRNAARALARSRGDVKGAFRHLAPQLRRHGRGLARMAGRLGGKGIGARLGIGAASRVGVAAAGAGASGGAATGSAAVAGGGVVAALGGPLGVAALAIVGVGIAATGTAIALHKFGQNTLENSKKLIESQQHLTQFNGRMAIAAMKLEIGQLKRDLTAANATSESYSNLADSQNRLADSLAPVDNAWANLKNNWQTMTNNIAASINESLGPYMSASLDTLNEILFEQRKTNKKKDEEPITDTTFVMDEFRRSADARNKGKFGPPIPNTGTHTDKQLGK